MYQIVKKFNSDSKLFSGHPIYKLMLLTFSFLLIGWIYLYSLPANTHQSWDRDLYLDQFEPTATVSIANDKDGHAPESKPTVTTSNNTSVANNAKNKTVSTSRPENTTQNVASGPETEKLLAKIAFYGDSQSDTEAEETSHGSTCNLLLASGADPIFHLGDLLEDGTEDSLNRFNRASSVMRNSRTFYAAQGNNERNSAFYFGNFVFPNNEHWYSVEVSNLHIIVLDSAYSSTAPGSLQYNWLLSDLQGISPEKFTIVIFHHPPYGLGGDTKGLIGTIVPLFRNNGVDLVVSGHEHAYQKNIVDGIPYFISSGQPLIGYFIAESYNSRIELSYYNSSGYLVEKSMITRR